MGPMFAVGAVPAGLQAELDARPVRIEEPNGLLIDQCRVVYNTISPHSLRDPEPIAAGRDLAAESGVWTVDVGGGKHGGRVMLEKLPDHVFFC